MKTTLLRKVKILTLSDVLVVVVLLGVKAGGRHIIKIYIHKCKSCVLVAAGQGSVTGIVKSSPVAAQLPLPFFFTSMTVTVRQEKGSYCSSNTFIDCFGSFSSRVLV